MATERRPASGTQKRPTTRVGGGGTQRHSRPAPSTAVRRKNNMPLIIGGVAGGAVLVIILVAVAASGGSKKKAADEDTKSSSRTGPTGPKVDENMLKGGMHKCEQGRAMVQSLKSRLEKIGSMNDGQRAALRADLEKAQDMLEAGMRDIENSKGREHVNEYQNALKECRKYLMELSSK
jgi:hypothetical protein